MIFGIQFLQRDWSWMESSSYCTYWDITSDDEPCESVFSWCLPGGAVSILGDVLACASCRRRLRRCLAEQPLYLSLTPGPFAGLYRLGKYSIRHVRDCRLCDFFHMANLHHEPNLHSPLSPFLWSLSVSSSVGTLSCLPCLCPHRKRKAREKRTIIMKCKRIKYEIWVLLLGPEHWSAQGWRAGTRGVRTQLHCKELLSSLLLLFF